MPTHCLTNQIFTYRLHLFKTSHCHRRTDFIPDTVFNLLEGIDFVAVLFALNTILDNELHGNYATLYKHVINTLYKYKYFVQL